MKFGRSIVTDGLQVHFDTRTTKCWQPGTLILQNMANYTPIPSADIDTNGTLSKTNGCMRIHSGSRSSGFTTTRFEWTPYAISASQQFTVEWSARYNAATSSINGTGHSFFVLPSLPTDSSKGYFGTGVGDYFTHGAIGLDDSGSVYVVGQHGGFQNQYSAHNGKFDSSGSLMEWNAPNIDGTVNSTSIAYYYNGKMFFGGTNHAIPGIYVTTTDDGTNINTISRPYVGGRHITGDLVFDPTENKVYAFGCNGTSYSGSAITRKILRLEADENFQLDTSFNTTTEAFNTTALDSGCIISGSLYAGGAFTTFGTSSAGRIIKLDKLTGQLDTTFNTNSGTGFNNRVYNVHPTTNNQIICAGQFNGYNGDSVNRICKLNLDGTIDSTFATNIGTGFNNIVYGADVQSDGKIVCVGEFTSFNGTLTRYVARINSDGTLDTTFATNVGNAFGQRRPSFVKIQPDGKILISYQNLFAYQEQTWDNVPIPQGGVIRLTADGFKDPDWNMDWVPVSLYRLDSSIRHTVSSNQFAGSGLWGFGGGRSYYDGDENSQGDLQTTAPEGLLQRVRDLHTYSFTFNGTSMRFYLDGEYTGRTVTPAGPYSISPPRFQLPDALIDVDFVNFKIYNRALSDEEIAKNYEASTKYYDIPEYDYFGF